MVCARASTSLPRFASVGTRPGFPASCPNDRPVPASRAADYFRLRTAHRIIGAMVGGLPGFRQQDAVHGLPLQLSPEEVTLAVDEGWVELYELDDPPESYAFGEPGTSGGEGPSTTKPPPKPMPHRGVPAKGWGAKPKLAHNAKRIKGASPGGADWETFLQAAHITVPLRRDPPTGTTVGSNPTTGSEHRSPPRWTYPRTPAERRRYAVFADLHARGLTLTTGIKFGADFLAYPGDPMAYHASFTVRVCAENEGVHALTLLAAARMSHGARKNLVLASAAEAETARADGEEARVRMRTTYVTVTPDVEQSSNKGNRG